MHFSGQRTVFRKSGPSPQAGRSGGVDYREHRLARRAPASTFLAGPRWGAWGSGWEQGLTDGGGSERQGRPDEEGEVESAVERVKWRPAGL